MILFFTMIFSLNAMAAEGVATQGKAAAELYQAINNTEAGQCGSGCVDVRELNCTWSNTNNIRRVNCRFKDAAGQEHEVANAKARRLMEAVNSVRQLETSCGAGTCGFETAQNVKCREEKTAAKKLKQSCSVSAHSNSCLSAEQQKDLHGLKMKYSAMQEGNPGCETMRGAAGCLPARDMVKMQKLESMEKNGCKAKRRQLGRDVKPTMEAR